MHGPLNVKCRSVIICEIIVHLLVIIQNIKKKYKITKNVHYVIHKSPSLVPALIQINSLHAVSLYLLKMHLNIISITFY